jgi:hypothetical protein
LNVREGGSPLGKKREDFLINYFNSLDAPIVSSLTPILASDPFTLNTKLDCEVDSYPESTILWTYNDRQIFNSNKYSIIINKTSSYLIIQQLQSNFDYGLYTCNASNKLGKNSTTIQLRSKGNI